MQRRDPTLNYDQYGLKVRGHLQFGLNAVAESNLFWNLAATTAAGSSFNLDTEWLEGYVTPGLSFERAFDWSVNVLPLALKVKPSQQDTWTLRYAHIRAKEYNSPIQFRKAARLDVSGNGILVCHLRQVWLISGGSGS